MNEREQHLSIQKLELFWFRNYEHLLLSNIDRMSIFIGNNAVGKTSIIEAIQLLTELKSFRATNIEQLIYWGNSSSNLKLHIASNSRNLEEELVIQNNKREYFLNNKKKNIKDLKGLLPAVVFTPDNLNLVKGSNSLRRDALDNLGSQVSQNFYSVRQDYFKILKQKNQALKNEESKTYIQSLNDVLIKVGTQYIIHRTTLLQTFISLLKEAYRNITRQQEDIDLCYNYSWEIPEQNLFPIQDKNMLYQRFEQAIQTSFEEEYISRRSKIGPHNDKISFLIKEQKSLSNFKNAQLYASQGQQRSIVLAFKIAELQTIQNIISQKPVLLLDDVMSELDENRRHMLIELINNDIQTFITTTNLDYFDTSFLNNATIYKLPL